MASAGCRLVATLRNKQVTLNATSGWAQMPDLTTTLSGRDWVNHVATCTSEKSLLMNTAELQRKRRWGEGGWQPSPTCRAAVSSSLGAGKGPRCTGKTRLCSCLQFCDALGFCVPSLFLLLLNTFSSSNSQRLSWAAWFIPKFLQCCCQPRFPFKSLPDAMLPLTLVPALLLL